MRVTVVDAGMGNIHSISSALHTVGGEVEVTAVPERILASERLVLPGVGAFGRCMAELGERHLLEPLQAYHRSGRPMLGICLGFQVLFQDSTELGVHRGLGWIDGHVEQFENTDLIVPHMGWNRVVSVDHHHLMDGVEDGAHAYFVHSYRPVRVPESAVVATSDYGEHFVCAVGLENVVGVQFHPEKSGPVGLRMLANFLRWSPT